MSIVIGVFVLWCLAIAFLGWCICKASSNREKAWGRFEQEG